MMNILGRNYPDTPSSLLQTCPLVQNQTWTSETFTTGGNNSGFNPKQPY